MANFGRRPSRFRDRESGRSSGSREMYSATCSNCGKDCRVPFRPSGGKPVYCSDCFEKMGNSTESRSFGARDKRRTNFGTRNERRSSFKGHEAICDDCGKRCYVPFRPESGKPIYCDDCFPKHSKNGAGSARAADANRGDLERQVAELNLKVDQILEILQTAVVGMEDDFEEDIVAEIVEEPVIEDEPVVVEEKKKVTKKTTKTADKGTKTKKASVNKKKE